MELAVRRMIERRVDGVAILTFGMEDALIEDLRFRKVPLVFVDVGPQAAGVTNIRVNYQQGIREAVSHLANLGHKRIAFVAGPTNLKSAMARRAAFEAAMQENGLTVDSELIVTGDHKVEGGIAALAQLAALSKKPTAILCSNDMTAVGVMREAYDRGITIPRELSVIGFDDIRLAEFTTPPLTTVRMSQKQLAEYAFQALRGEVEGHGDSANGKEVELETSLILRGSTAKVPA
jgi:LacI family transcriptional regulator